MSGLVDPKDLTKAERSALQACTLSRLYRAKNGWRIPGEAKLIPLKTIAAIERRGLVVEMNSKGRPQLRPTGSGNNVLAVMQERGM